MENLKIDLFADAVFVFHPREMFWNCRQVQCPSTLLTGFILMWVTMYRGQSNGRIVPWIMF